MNTLLIAVSSGVLATIGWGLSDFFSAIALKKNKINNSLAVFLLYLITSAILWITLIVTNQPTEIISVTSFLQINFFAILNFVSFILFFKALQIGKLSIISTLFSTYPIGASIISILFFAEITNSLRIISLSIVIIGILFISLQNLQKPKIGKGIKEVLIAGILLAIFFPLFDQFLQVHSANFYWSAVTDSIMTIMFFINFIIQNKSKKIKFAFNKNLFFAATFNSLAILGITYGLQKTNLTSVVTVISGAVPLVSATLGYFVFKEKLTKLQYIGIGAILIGTFILFGS